MRRWAWVSCCCFLGLIAMAADAVATAGYARHVRDIETASLGVADPSGIAFLPESDALFVLSTDLSTGGEAVRAATISTFGEALSMDAFRIPLSDPINVTFDERSRTLIVLDAARSGLLAIQLDGDGLPRPASVERFGPLAWSVVEPRGLASDPSTGALLVLDASEGRLLRIEPTGGYGASALVSGSVTALTIDVPGADALRGLAYDRRTGHAYVLNPALATLYEIDSAGRVVTTRPLSAANPVDPQGLAFASSGDQTDPAWTLSLYVADSGATSTFGDGSLVEISVVEPEPGAPAPRAAGSSLINTIDTSRFAQPSPDPSGLAYHAGRGRLLICDGEVDEMSIYAGANVWETSLGGTVAQTSNTLGFSNEPTDIAVNPFNGHWFFTDDNKRLVFEVNLGGDGRLGTSDDVVTSFSTSAFGSGDPEGVTFDTTRRHLVVSDGVNAEVYDVNPGANGRFDGVPPAGDDQVTHFDTGAAGYGDPEGVDYNADTNTLFIVSRNVRGVLETTMTGSVIRDIDLSFLGALQKAAGVSYAPASTGSGAMSLYIADRAVDNNSDPRENDGKVFEVSIPGDEPPPPPGTAVDVRVSASTDDAEEAESGGITLRSSDLELVFDGSSQVVGMRFTGVGIARGAPVADAWIQFKTDEVTTEATTLTIHGQAADNPGTFTSTGRDISSRPRTTAAVPWTPTPWTVVGETSSAQRATGLAPIVQEIVNRPGWAAGNAIVIIVTGTGRRTAEAFDGDASGAPLLHVNLASDSCGNGALDPGEACDGSNLGGASCADRNCGSGTPICTSSCTLDFSTCGDCRVCGNGVKEAGEICDGTDLGGESCQTQGFGSGSLACRSDCTGFDTSACSVCDFNGSCGSTEDCHSCPNECASGGPVCGNRICESANGENCRTCPADCNGVQNGKPSGRYCCGDGGGTNPVSCADPRCSASGRSCSAVVTPVFCCGNGTCELGETGASCAVDCAF